VPVEDKISLQIVEQEEEEFLLPMGNMNDD